MKKHTNQGFSPKSQEITTHTHLIKKKGGDFTDFFSRGSKASCFSLFFRVYTRVSDDPEAPLAVSDTRKTSFVTKNYKIIREQKER